MRYLLKAAIALAAAAYVCGAQAALIDAGQYALDPSTGLEWLYPTSTATGSGWRLATEDEFAALPSEYDSGVDFAGQLIAALGGPTSTFSTGVFQGETLEGALSGGNEGYFTEYSAPSSMSEWDYGSAADLGLGNIGSFLVRSDVPEAPSWAMLLIGLVGLAYAGKRRIAQ